MQRHHLERVLFVVGNRHCGKSTRLRSMFKDVRLSTAGSIPKDRKLVDFHRLTNDRFLYLRLSSPHELKGTPTQISQENREQNKDCEFGIWNTLEFRQCVADQCAEQYAGSC